MRRERIGTTRACPRSRVLSSNIQVGLQVNNITNTVTKLTTGPRLYPTDGYLDTTVYNRVWFMNDRRYSAVLRASW